MGGVFYTLLSSQGLTRGRGYRSSLSNSRGTGKWKPARDFSDQQPGKSSFQGSRGENVSRAKKKNLFFKALPPRKQSCICEWCGGILPCINGDRDRRSRLMGALAWRQSRRREEEQHVASHIYKIMTHNIYINSVIPRTCRKSAQKSLLYHA